MHSLTTVDIEICECFQHIDTPQVVTLPPKTSRDAVDHHDAVNVFRGVTPAPSVSSPCELDEPMQTEVYEFSDVEIEEPVRSRTRSQSRMKESSVPPVDLEPEKKNTRVRRTSRKPESKAAPTKVRRRRAIVEEPITDDE